MRRAKICVHGQLAGYLSELERGKRYRFEYLEHYRGDPVSLRLPTTQAVYEFDRFPPFFDGLLPEGVQLDALLRQEKLDRDDCFSQLVIVGGDLVGAVTVEEEQ